MRIILRLRKGLHILDEFIYYDFNEPGRPGFIKHILTGEFDSGSD